MKAAAKIEEFKLGEGDVWEVLDSVAQFLSK